MELLRELLGWTFVFGRFDADCNRAKEANKYYLGRYLGSLNC